MQFNVPQFIDIEDKIVGPLTAKQLGWLAIGGVILLIIWNIFDFSAFIIFAVIIFLVFGSLAFLKPHGIPLFKFVTASIFFLFRPKTYIWKRSPKKMKLERAPKKKTVTPERKSLNQKKVIEISKLLDQ